MPKPSSELVLVQVQKGCAVLCVHQNPMALEAFADGNSDKVHTDVLTKAREDCYKVKHFDRQYCQNKRVQRLLDDNASRRGV
ncbi:hypothetical protein Ahy_A01g001355 isoform B [Arachis hypogaea]|uniref:Uncharacterized protein n=1 Tax=Arachis hypogaea TaxID=3818 RepID=A0A445EMX1_ARAHY|nr:hypothetical protein Ahy_A01g001355 isoform B [Arachis hypogaea]